MHRISNEEAFFLGEAADRPSGGTPVAAERLSRRRNQRGRFCCRRGRRGAATTSRTLNVIDPSELLKASWAMRAPAIVVFVAERLSLLPGPLRCAFSTSAARQPRSATLGASGRPTWPAPITIALWFGISRSAGLRTSRRCLRSGSGRRQPAPRQLDPLQDRDEAAALQTTPLLAVQRLFEVGVAATALASNR